MKTKKNQHTPLTNDISFVESWGNKVATEPRGTGSDSVVGMMLKK